MSARLFTRMKKTRFASTVVCVGVFALVELSGTSAHGQTQVRVRGSAALEAHTRRQGDHIRVQGTLLDDNGSPIAHSKIALEVVASEAHVQPCGGALESDDRGAFCADVFGLGQGRVSALVSASVNGTLYEAKPIEIFLEPTKGAVVLTFLKLPVAVYLGKSAEFVVRAETEDGGAATHLPLVVTLDGSPLATGTTDDSGELVVALGEKLTTPGNAELSVKFLGNDELAQEKVSRVLEKRARVSLRFADGEEGRLKKGIDPDRFTLEVIAEKSGTFLPQGEVELFIDDVPERVFPLHDGRASIAASFEPAHEDATIAIRFLPPNRWVEGDSAISTVAKIKSGTSSRSLFLFIPVVVVAFVLFRRPKRAKPRDLATNAGPARYRNEPSVSVVETLASGFSGRVVDLHERYPIAGARVWLEKKRFAAMEVVASTTTDGEGKFDLPDVSGKDLQVSAEAPYHRILRKSVAGPGSLEISLASRKRAILEQLVIWARSAGPPYDARPEPTPGHVANVTSASNTRAWAHSLERAAYSDVEVDALVENSLEQMKPSIERPGGQTEVMLSPVEMEPAFANAAIESAQAQEEGRETNEDPPRDVTEKDLNHTRRGFL